MVVILFEANNSEIKVEVNAPNVETTQVLHYRDCILQNCRVWRQTVGQLPGPVHVKERHLLFDDGGKQVLADATHDAISSQGEGPGAEQREDGAGGKDEEQQQHGLVHSGWHDQCPTVDKYL